MRTLHTLLRCAESANRQGAMPVSDFTQGDKLGDARDWTLGPIGARGWIAATTHHGLTIPQGAMTWLKGGWLGTELRTYHSELAQNFWTAVWAWSVCSVATVVVSVLTPQRKRLEELRGLVYSLTARQQHPELVWYQQPLTFGVIVLAACVLLNILFW